MAMHVLQYCMVKLLPTTYSSTRVRTRVHSSIVHVCMVPRYYIFILFAILLSLHVPMGTCSRTGTGSMLLVPGCHIVMKILKFYWFR